MQLALRELRGHFSDPRVAGSLLLVAAILGFSGPFGTFQYLSTVPRLIYWLAVVVLTYGVGFALAVTVGRIIRERLAQPALRVLAVGVLIGPPVTVVVLGINLLTFGAGGLQAIDWLVLLINATLIAIGVTAIAEIVAFSLRGAAKDRAAAPAAAPPPPPILQRVPLPQRGKLLALSVQDHYVEVVTDRGKALVLMRLADAMRETGETKGLQIHRSHWVALDAVTRVLRSGGKPMVELSSGGKLPISRGFLPGAKAAGLVV